MTRFKHILAFGVFLLLASCGDVPFEDVSDSELADEIYACRTSGDQSPGFAIRCDNLKRECDRRRDAGRYVC